MTTMAFVRPTTAASSGVEDSGEWSSDWVARTERERWTALIDCTLYDKSLHVKTCPNAATYSLEVSSWADDLRRTFRSFTYRQAESAESVTTNVFDSKFTSFIEGMTKLKTFDPDDPTDLPTGFAFSNALRVVSCALALARAEKPTAYLELPEPAFSTDDLGGVRLIWVKDGRHLRANFGGRPELRSYLYHEIGTEHGIEELESELLLSRLYWLTA